MKIFFIIAALLIISCTKPQLSKEEMEKIISERNEALGNCFKSGDMDKLALMYDENAKLCPNGADFHVGRNHIKAFWTKASEGTKVLDMQTTTLSVDGNEDVIYETGKVTTTMQINDSIQTFKSKYANVWKKQADGNYLIDVDIWNSLD